MIPLVHVGRPAIRPSLAAPIAAGGLAFVSYLRTLDPGIAFGDWGEMQVVPHVLGIAHPTGYPTYLLVAALAELIPIGSVAFRANLLSAMFVALAVATLTAIAQRVGVRPLAAAAAALAFGAVGTVWAAATVAEVNPLHLLFIALLLHRALIWQDEERARDLALGGLLLGLSLGNHLLTATLAPFLVLFVLWAGRHAFLRHPALLLVPIATGIVGLLVYLYIPIRAAANPPLAYNHPTTLDGVVWLVSGTQFRGQFDFLSASGPGRFVAAIPDLFALLVDRGTIVLPVLGILGLGLLLLRRPAFGLACVAILVMGGYVWANYLRLEHYLLVPWLILGIGAAMSIDWVVGAIRASVDVRIGRPLAVVAAAAVTVAVVAVNVPAADRSDDHSGQAYVDQLFAALPENAAILSYWDASTPLWYAQLVEGLRPDVLVVDDTNIVYEDWGTRERRIASLICDRPVFILRLDDRDLEPTRQAYLVTPVTTVKVAGGGPSAVVDRPVDRVSVLDPSTC